MIKQIALVGILGLALVLATAVYIESAAAAANNTNVSKVGAGSLANVSRSIGAGLKGLGNLISPEKK